MLPEARDEYEAAAQQIGFSIAEQLTNGVNRHTNHQIAIGFANGMLRSHRTLQQSAILALAEGLLAYAKESKDFTDLRNEFAVKTLLKMEPQLRELCHAPFI